MEYRIKEDIDGRVFSRQFNNAAEAEAWISKSLQGEVKSIEYRGVTEWQMVDMEKQTEEELNAEQEQSSGVGVGRFG